MKNLAIAAVIFLAVQVRAQAPSTEHTENLNSNRFYVDLVSKAAGLNGDWGLLGGLRAGYNLNKNISIGLSGHGLIPEKLGKSYINRASRDELHLGYGGVETGYKQSISDRFYLEGTLLIGAGRVDYDTQSGYDYFFITEPAASINYSVVEWFGVGAAVSYRVASGVKYADFSNASFSGWTSNLSFKFGF